MIVKSKNGEHKMIVFPSQINRFHEFLQKEGFKIIRADPLDKFVEVDKPFWEVIERERWSRFMFPNQKFREFLKSLGL